MLPLCRHRLLIYHNFSNESATVGLGRSDVPYVPGEALISHIWWQIGSHYMDKPGEYRISLCLSDDFGSCYGLPSKTKQAAIYTKTEELTLPGCTFPGVFPSTEARNRHIVKKDKFLPLLSGLLREKQDEIEQANNEFLTESHKRLAPFKRAPETDTEKASEFTQLQKCYRNKFIPEFCAIQIERIISELKALKKGDSISEAAATLMLLPANDLSMDNVRTCINKVVRDELTKSAIDS